MQCNKAVTCSLSVVLTSYSSCLLGHATSDPKYAVGNVKVFWSCRYQEGHDGQELEADESNVAKLKEQLLQAEATVFSLPDLTSRTFTHFSALIISIHLS